MNTSYLNAFLISIVTFFLLSNAQAQMAKVTHMEGEVWLNRGPAKIGDLIYPGTHVKVAGAKSWVDMKYINGHVVRATEGAFTVTEIGPKKSFIELLSGKIFSLVSPLKKKETFVVKTKRAVFGVRGTKFMIEENAEKTYLCVCEGVVEADNGKEKVKVKKDDDLFIEDGKKLTVNKASAMMNQMLTDMVKNIETVK
ncbi:MAG: FecR domain-containing protein [Bacteriovoracaceae bacterium]